MCLHLFGKDIQALIRGFFIAFALSSVELDRVYRPLAAICFSSLSKFSPLFTKMR
jgi:hypothetical protein